MEAREHTDVGADVRIAKFRGPRCRTLRREEAYSRSEPNALRMQEAEHSQGLRDVYASCGPFMTTSSFEAVTKASSFFGASFFECAWMAIVCRGCPIQIARSPHRSSLGTLTARTSARMKSCEVASQHATFLIERLTQVHLDMPHTYDDEARRLAQQGCALSKALIKEHVAECCERYSDAFDHERDRTDKIELNDTGLVGDGYITRREIAHICVERKRRGR